MIDVESLITAAGLHEDFWVFSADSPIGLFQSPAHTYAREIPTYLSVCAIYRNESRYLREWIEFHRLVGVERFFLYDNLSEDDHRTILAPYVEEGTVTLHDWPVEPGQLHAYEDCLRWHRHDSRWIAFIDLDGSLLPVDDRYQEILIDYEQWPAVVAKWAMFGTGGHVVRPLDS